MPDRTIKPYNNVIVSHTKELVYDQAETTYTVEADQYDCLVRFRVYEKQITGDVDLLLSGDVRWDGCSNWNTESYVHFCTQEEIVAFGKLLADLWTWASELLGPVWDNPHAFGNFN